MASLHTKAVAEGSDGGDCGWGKELPWQETEEVQILILEVIASHLLAVTAPGPAVWLSPALYMEAVRQNGFNGANVRI